jgi:hypothetical protein
MMGATIPRPGKWNPEGWHDLHQEALKKADTGQCSERGQVAKTIKHNRWSTKVTSPFWDLLWMQQSFFLCFSICFLHLQLLGLFKVHSDFATFTFTNFFILETP